MNETFFSTADFVTAWTRSYADNQYHSLAIPVKGSGPPRTMYAIKLPERYGTRYVWPIRRDFCLSPGWEGQLESSTLKHMLRELMSLRTRSFVWNVRFDHEPLAVGLVSLGLTFERESTRVIYLHEGYERVFGGYNATMRKQVRKAQRRGVTVRQTINPADIRAYYQLYVRLGQQKNWTLYPVELTLELLKLSGIARFFVAECEGRIIGGGLFVRDGCSIYGFHVALDHEYSHCFPVCAVLDNAIRWSCDSGAAFFNLGFSGENVSLERFKASWGAHEENNWRFEWTNPFWARGSALKSTLKRNLNAFRPKQI